MNLQELIGKWIEFQSPDYLDGDRLEGKVQRVINDVLIVDVEGREVRVEKDWITGTGFRED